MLPDHWFEESLPKRPHQGLEGRSNSDLFRRRQVQRRNWRRSRRHQWASSLLRSASQAHFVLLLIVCLCCIYTLQYMYLCLYTLEVLCQCRLFQISIKSDLTHFKEVVLAPDILVLVSLVSLFPGLAPGSRVKPAGRPESISQDPPRARYSFFTPPFSRRRWGV